MLFSNYLILILIASLLIFPVSYYWLDNWLAQFATRVTISLASITVSLLLVVATTLITVWVQSLQTIRINPARVLKE